jgi:hypothetical protein
MGEVEFGDPRLPARFWSKVIVSPSGCWLWAAAKDHRGYGRYSLNGRDPAAHRVAHEALIGPIPDGLYVLHGCDTPSCVNPNHLRAGTQGDNLRECVDRGRHPWANKMHCLAGHPYDEANTYVDSRGRRHCRTCRRERGLRWWRRNIGAKQAAQ